jgi:hypothetical protein
MVDDILALGLGGQGTRNTKLPMDRNKYQDQYCV